MTCEFCDNKTEDMIITDNEMEACEKCYSRIYPWK